MASHAPDISPVLFVCLSAPRKYGDFVSSSTGPYRSVITASSAALVRATPQPASAAPSCAASPVPPSVNRMNFSVGLGRASCSVSALLIRHIFFVVRLSILLFDFRAATRSCTSPTPIECATCLWLMLRVIIFSSTRSISRTATCPSSASICAYKCMLTA